MSEVFQISYVFHDKCFSKLFSFLLDVDFAVFRLNIAVSISSVSPLELFICHKNKELIPKFF